MSFYKEYGTDHNLESGQGVDLDYGDCGTITIHRAGGSNKRYAEVAAAKLKPYKRQIQNGTADAEAIRKVMIEIYAHAVIVDWKGVKDADGKEMKYSRQNVIKLMTDLPDLFSDIQEQADRVSLFRKEQIEEVAKN